MQINIKGWIARPNTSDKYVFTTVDMSEFGWVNIRELAFDVAVDMGHEDEIDARLQHLTSKLDKLEKTYTKDKSDIIEKIANLREVQDDLINK